MTIAGSLNFGGPAGFPSGRSDTTLVIADSVSHLRGAHSIKFGGEYRHFFSNGYPRDTGRFNFPSVAAFLNGTPDSFSITLGDRSYSIAQGTLGLFVQDNYKWRNNVTVELGLRYDWNMTPTERNDRFIVFEPDLASLVRVRRNVDNIYHQNARNIQPRVGFAWDPFSDQKTAIRGGYAILVDEPITSIVSGTTANPPRGMPLTFTGAIDFGNAINLARAAGLAPVTIEHDYDNPYLQSWNLNVQRELPHSLALMAGYFGSKATHQVIRRNLNQPVNGVRPYTALSVNSPIMPGQAVGNITEVEGAGNSSYNALWITADQQMSRGLHFNASYTWAKSIDYNSLSSAGVVVQDSNNLRGDRGLSDFDVRHRFVLRSIYELPFKRNRLVRGWQLSAIFQVQSGNPINIVTSNSALTGSVNTVRPDVTGPITIIGTADRWFDPSVFTAVSRFGNLGRNVVTGPGFNNTDIAVTRTMAIDETMRVQFRTEFFNLFNHPNLGQPGNMVSTPNFGRITSTRFPTGESGSSRQLQFAVKLLF
jgi:outer membrane receptor protein involved in Fe transport